MTTWKITGITGEGAKVFEVWIGTAHLGSILGSLVAGMEDYCRQCMLKIEVTCVRYEA